MGEPGGEVVVPGEAAAEAVGGVGVAVGVAEDAEDHENWAWLSS